MHYNKFESRGCGDYSESIALNPSGIPLGVYRVIDAGLQRPGASAPPAALSSLGGVSLAGTAAPV